MFSTISGKDLKDSVYFKFQVLIFDPGSLEIDYPLAGSDRPDFVKSTQAKKRVLEIDDSSSSDNVVRPCKKTRTKSPSAETSSKLRQEEGEENVRLTGVTNEADRARMLESVKAFKPKHPYFIVQVHKSYLYGGSITVPMEFIHGYITKDSCDVILQLGDGRVWSVKCYINKKCAKFSAGWKNFSKENNLAAGDFGGFELVNQRLLKVVIFRVKL